MADRGAFTVIQCMPVAKILQTPVSTVVIALQASVVSESDN